MSPRSLADVAFVPSLSNGQAVASGRRIEALVSRIDRQIFRLSNVNLRIFSLHVGFLRCVDALPERYLTSGETK